MDRIHGNQYRRLYGLALGRHNARPAALRIE
jgi:hypothetical protein